MTAVLGWDVGGVNTKVASVVRGTVAAVRAQPYEIQRDPTALASLLARLAAEQGAAGGGGGGGGGAPGAPWRADRRRSSGTSGGGGGSVSTPGPARFPGAACGASP